MKTRMIWLTKERNSNYINITDYMKMMISNSPLFPTAPTIPEVRVPWPLSSANQSPFVSFVPQVVLRTQPLTFVVGRSG
jgi:hypothetical protein